MAVTLEGLENGATVYQLTQNPLEKSNIYCEQPYCSADSRVFVYERTVSGPNYNEYVVCEFGTWETEVLGRGLRAPGMSHTGISSGHPGREGNAATGRDPFYAQYRGPRGVDRRGKRDSAHGSCPRRQGRAHARRVV